MMVTEDAKLKQRLDDIAKSGQNNVLISIRGLGRIGLGKGSPRTFAGILMGQKPFGATPKIRRSAGSIATRKRPSATKNSEAKKMWVTEDAKLEQNRDDTAKNGFYNHLISIKGLGSRSLGKESSRTFAGILMGKKQFGATPQIGRSAGSIVNRRRRKKGAETREWKISKKNKGKIAKTRKGKIAKTRKGRIAKTRKGKIAKTRKGRIAKTRK